MGDDIISRVEELCDEAEAVYAGSLNTPFAPVEIADLRELLALARSNRDALSDSECAICGKEKARHTMNCGVGMCQIYPQFVSKRAMFERLTATSACPARRVD